MVEVELTLAADGRYEQEESYLCTSLSDRIHSFFLADSRAMATEIAVRMLRYDGAQVARYHTIPIDIKVQ